ncbi:hypothetical protein FDA94_33690 [Herbidospora galbida]|uniref:HIT domain-containing protein n=1 Tax=Herbidospora galbida TaxID=2575442 RepID=A0A4U3LZD9_9ACTN|nr:hypothetical protein [Herbidospora galbida]TKK81222.1 hypothetical protein FDA94_33690 [Herbidospora galbida]
MIADCFLCRSAAGADDIPWTDRPLWLDPRCGVVLPGMGGLSPGYLLLAPIRHVHSLRTAVASDRSERDFREFVAEVLDFLVRRHGDLTYWEHGGASTENLLPRSACIDHAHLHIVPGFHDLPRPPACQSFPDLASALSDNPEDGAPYLLLGHHKGPCHVGADIGRSQYYRREWAKILGKPDHWDYLVTEDGTNTMRTIDSFFPHRA